MALKKISMNSVLIKTECHSYGLDADVEPVSALDLYAACLSSSNVSKIKITPKKKQKLMVRPRCDKAHQQEFNKNTDNNVSSMNGVSSVVRENQTRNPQTSELMSSTTVAESNTSVRINNLDNKLVSSTSSSCLTSVDEFTKKSSLLETHASIVRQRMTLVRQALIAEMMAKRHKQNEQAIMTYRCQMCQAKFQSRSVLLTHNQVMHRINDRPTNYGIFEILLRHFMLLYATTNKAPHTFSTQFCRFLDSLMEKFCIGQPTSSSKRSHVNRLADGGDQSKKRKAERIVRSYVDRGLCPQLLHATARKIPPGITVRPALNNNVSMTPNQIVPQVSSRLISKLNNAFNGFRCQTQPISHTKLLFRINDQDSAHHSVLSQAQPRSSVQICRRRIPISISSCQTENLKANKNVISSIPIIVNNTVSSVPLALTTNSINNDVMLKEKDNWMKVPTFRIRRLDILNPSTIIDNDQPISTPFNSIATTTSNSNINSLSSQVHSRFVSNSQSKINNSLVIKRLNDMADTDNDDVPFVSPSSSPSLSENGVHALELTSGTFELDAASNLYHVQHPSSLLSSRDVSLDQQFVLNANDTRHNSTQQLSADVVGQPDISTYFWSNPPPCTSFLSSYCCSSSSSNVARFKISENSQKSISSADHQYLAVNLLANGKKPNSVVKRFYKLNFANKRCAMNRKFNSIVLTGKNRYSNKTGSQ